MDILRVKRLKKDTISSVKSPIEAATTITTKINNKMEQLSGVMIIIIIGGGVMIFVILFIFAKRQIMRFTLRSRRGPHVPIGNDAKKSLRREIERRLDCIQKIAFEPKLLWNDDKYILRPDQPLPPYYYRMQAVDDVKILEKEIAKHDGSKRLPHDSLRAFLLTTLAPALNGSGQRMIHQFCDMYEHARHDPNEFGNEEYEAYHRLLLKLIDAAKALKSFPNSRKTSPSRTPVKKQTKMHSLLDPSRLRPPPLTTASIIDSSDGSNCGRIIGNVSDTTTTKAAVTTTTAGLNRHQQSKVNLTLGLGQQPQPIHHENQLNIRNVLKSSATITNEDNENEVLSISQSQ